MKEEIYKINTYYEGLIQNLYAGSQGCMVAFLQFFYQFNQCSVFQPNHAECFKTLYETELQNCQILSDILIRIGGDNKYFSSARKFLSGYNVDYLKNLQKVFLADIELLEINIIEVKNIIEKIDNVKIKTKLKLVMENKKNCLKLIKECFFKNNMR